MYMSDKLFKSELNPTEKLVLAYILRGHHRYKYIALETFSKELYMSQPTISKTIKQLEQRELVKWVRVEGNKYKILIVCQKAFNKYAFLGKDDVINEKKITRDNVINTLGEIEANKELIKFEKDKKSGKITPKWYDKYKEEGKELPPTDSEATQKEMEALVNSLF